RTQAVPGRVQPPSPLSRNAAVPATERRRPAAGTKVVAGSPRPGRRRGVSAQENGAGRAARSVSGSPPAVLQLGLDRPAAGRSADPCPQRFDAVNLSRG